ncbi:MAG: hypothetical protein ACOY8P_01575 [Thermodesulfobacteriota bacterium]
MRYLYAIGIFILLFSASFLAYRFFPAATAPEDIAIRINDRVITRAEFNQKYQARGGVQDPFTAQPGEEFIQALITKELLIQEAKRLGLDREESFRQSVQNFYEQSLIKLLMERRYATLPAVATEAELGRYRQLAGHTLHLAIASFPTKKEASGQRPTREQTTVVSFEDLAGELKAALLAVEVGTPTAPLAAGDHYETYRIAALEDDPAATGQMLSPTATATVIHQYKREKAMSDWLAGLREAAAITVHVKPETSHE